MSEDILNQFKSKEEFDSWYHSLPVVPASDAWSFEPDLRKSQKVKTSIQLNKYVIERYQELAERKKLRGGQTLMKLVLEEYLNQYDKAKP